MSDETPGTAEIYRILQDFRNEYRSSQVLVVRRDVYEANMATVNLRHDNLMAAVKAIQEEADEDRKERRAIRRWAIGISLPGILSLLIAVIGWLIK